MRFLGRPISYLGPAGGDDSLPAPRRAGRVIGTGTSMALSASALGKTYQLGERLRLGGVLTRRLRGESLHQRPLDALADITFDVPEGTCLGIVGTNGSGK